jgi:hypothetical protein
VDRAAKVAAASFGRTSELSDKVEQAEEELADTVKTLLRMAAVGTVLRTTCRQVGLAETASSS